MKRILACLTAVALMAASQAGASASLGLGDRAVSSGLRGSQSDLDSDLLGLTGEAGFLVMAVGMIVVIGLAIDGSNDSPSSP